MSEILVKLFIKNSEDVKNNAVRQAYGTLGSTVGIIANLLLCILKISIGIIVHSISIIGDSLNNLSDMGSSVITMIGFKLAGKPADKSHPFGHGRMEYMSAFIVSILIFVVGFELFKSSVSSLFSNTVTPTYTVFAIIALIISVLVKLWLFLFNNKIGKKINSEALIATAKDSLNDCLTTGVILVSVAISMLIKLPFNLDALMGIFVAIFILYAGFSSAKATIDQILGMPPEKQLIEEIESTILSFEEFIGIHDLMVHNYGPGRQFASVHVEVPQNTDIVKCHEQVDLCEKILFEKFNISVVIHMDPIDTDNESVSQTKELLACALKNIHEALTLHDFRMTPITEKQTNLIFDVVIPAEFNMSEDQLHQLIIEEAKKINPTFNCVITYDNDYTGK